MHICVCVHFAVCVCVHAATSQLQKEPFLVLCHGPGTKCPEKIGDAAMQHTMNASKFNSFHSKHKIAN